MITKFNSTNIPSKLNSLNNKVVVVDGIVGGGKGLLSPIISALPKVEMWIHRPQIEQICAMHYLSHISIQGANALLKTWLDNEVFNSAISREINYRPSDLSSVFHSARPWKYITRMFQSSKVPLEKVYENNIIVNVMTHSNTPYALPLFTALDDRLVYIRITRCPMAEYMLNHLARWSKRWGSDNDVRYGMLLSKKSNDYSLEVPFFMSDNEEKYLKAPPLERAILILECLQKKGDTAIDHFRKSSNATIIEIPYEKFVFDPNTYINEISKLLDTSPDYITKRVLKKQGVPRRSLTDAPKSKLYSTLGHRPPKKHMTVSEEVNCTREFFKGKLSIEAMNLLNSLTDEYMERHGL